MMQILSQIAQLTRGKDPESLVMQMVQNNNINSPEIIQLISLAQNGDMNGIMNFASNFFANKGLDFNSEFNAFMSMLR